MKYKKAYNLLLDVRNFRLEIIFQIQSMYPDTNHPNKLYYNKLFIETIVEIRLHDNKLFIETIVEGKRKNTLHSFQFASR